METTRGCDKSFVQSTFTTRDKYTIAREIWRRTETKTESSFVNTTRVTSIIIFLTGCVFFFVHWIIIHEREGECSYPCFNQPIHPLFFGLGTLIKLITALGEIKRELLKILKSKCGHYNPAFSYRLLSGHPCSLLWSIISTCCSLFYQHSWGTEPQKSYPFPAKSFSYLWTLMVLLLAICGIGLWGRVVQITLCWSFAIVPALLIIFVDHCSTV